MPFLGRQTKAKPKCFFTVSTLPVHIDHERPPLQKQPFSSLVKQTFNHKLDIVIPETISTALRDALGNGKGTMRYSRVYLKLSDVLEGDFFNEYIKSGDILLLSEGLPGVDHVYSLADGVLHLEVDKATFERLGMNGVPISTEGRKHVNARFAIDINLRLPSMVRGKKAFDKIVWAFRNVLNHTLTWLFYDPKAQGGACGPIAVHAPINRKADSVVDVVSDVAIPAFPDNLEVDDHTEATELLEWLSLVFSGSRVVQQNDQPDSSLSRYRAPDGFSHSSDEQTQVQGLVTLHWHGFLPSTFIADILFVALKASRGSWFALSASSFDGHTATMLKHHNQALIWEYQN